jgi:hypothetical protein
MMRVIGRIGVHTSAKGMMDRPLLRYRKPFWFSLMALLVALGLGYALVIRPYHMRWGATDREVAMILPGDAAISADAAISTRAITIHAPVATVWAWLVQTGQNRGGGWHSYDWLENLFAADMHEVDHIAPRWQHLRVGDTMFFAAGGATYPVMVATVAGVEPERALWLHGGWSFVLQPIDATTTRLIVRYPMEPDEFFNPVLSFSFFEPAHFVMESGMILGIKRRAERDPQLRNVGARR